MQEPLAILTFNNISVPYQTVADFCRRHRIRELSLFGSALRDDFTDQSDVDAMANFLPDTREDAYKPRIAAKMLARQSIVHVAPR